MVQRPKLKKRKLHNWYEPWEMVVFKKAGNQYFEALMNLKYGGLSFKRQDNGEVGFTLQEKCAVLIRCKAHKDYGTELQGVDGCHWFYGVMVCYDGYDVEQPYDKQDEELYDIMELAGESDVYKGISEYYQENPDPGLELVFRGEEASWKLGKEHDYCMKDGVYVGQDHETDYDDGESGSSGEEEEEFDD